MVSEECQRTRGGNREATWASGGRHALLDDDLLPGGPDAGVGHGRASRQGSRGTRAGQSVGGDVLLVSLADDLEGADVGVGDVGDGVAVDGGLVGDGADLLDRQLGGRGSGEDALEGLVVAEGDEGAGTFCGRRGG